MTTLQQVLLLERRFSENGDYSCGQSTAERIDKKKPRNFHTVSTSTPTEKRMALLQPRTTKSNSHHQQRSLQVARSPDKSSEVSQSHSQSHIQTHTHTQTNPQSQSQAPTGHRYGFGHPVPNVTVVSDQSTREDGSIFCYSASSVSSCSSSLTGATQYNQQAGELEFYYGDHPTTTSSTTTTAAALAVPAAIRVFPSDSGKQALAAPLALVAAGSGGNLPPTSTARDPHRGSQVTNTSFELKQDVISRIATLATLRDEGFIGEDEYQRRKNAIMDELTFASQPYASQLTTTMTRSPLTRFDAGIPMIVPHPPDFQYSTPEIAVKHLFNYETRTWSSMKVYVNFDETPFSKGSLRVVYHLQDLNEVNCEGTYVAKLAIDPDEDPQIYFRDIELQAHCAHYARVYNSYNPPKRVEFIKAWILELTERNGALCAVEPYIPGDYRKHNNNFGCVSDDERNTPQAFSHFTYEASNHELLAVDIQGVGDKYTDPQIHTLNGNDFGKGNLGALGFQKFLSSHRCNSICRYLKLPPINPKEKMADYGTVPLQELMNKEKIRASHFESRHYYENAPLLQKYIARCRESEAQEQQRDGGCDGHGTWCGNPLTMFYSNSHQRSCGCVVQ